jgi:hypothetical protein
LHAPNSAANARNRRDGATTAEAAIDMDDEKKGM